MTTQIHLCTHNLSTLTSLLSQEACNLRLAALCNRFSERSISHLDQDAAKSDAITTSALLEDLNSLPFWVATLGLLDLYEPALSSILTGSQDLVAHLEAVAETSCQTKGLSTRHQQTNLNIVFDQGFQETCLPEIYNHDLLNYLYS